MIGNHAIPVIADAYLKGFNIGDAYQAAKISLTKSHLKSDWGIFDRYGYYPYDLVREESVSRTLESCYDDYAMARMSKETGQQLDYEKFSKRSNFYGSLLDGSIGYMRAKDSKGNWRQDFDLFDLSHAGTYSGDYTEGNALQYTWQVQHDIPGLVALMGGKQAALKKLDSLFTLPSTIKAKGRNFDVTGLIGQYAHGNEVSHHIAYIYTMLGKPARTQELIREIVDRFYISRPDGLCGNDDCGQMSAWHLFSVMGFYPVNPVGGQYILGAPQLKKISIKVSKGKTFTVTAKNLSRTNKYVQRILFNGQPYNKSYIDHRDIMKGGKMDVTMGSRPKDPI